MEEKTNINGVLLALIFLFAIVGAFLFLFPDAETVEKNPIDEFCQAKCNEKNLGDLIYSSNNSEQNIIECECVSEEIPNEGYDSKVRIETKNLYYNSITLEEVE